MPHLLRATASWRQIKIYFLKWSEFLKVQACKCAQKLFVWTRIWINLPFSSVYAFIHWQMKYTYSMFIIRLFLFACCNAFPQYILPKQRDKFVIKSVFYFAIVLLFCFSKSHSGQCTLWSIVTRLRWWVHRESITTTQSVSVLVSSISKCWIIYQTFWV